LIYVFDDYSLDPDRRELRRGAELVPVEPLVFDLLQHLIRYRDRVVSKDDLITAVWKGRFVSESTVTSRMNAVRSAVGDSGEQQRLVKTIARRGFRFVGEILEEQERRQGEVAKLAAARPIRQNEAMSPASSKTQAVTFCRTTDGVNIGVASVGQAQRWCEVPI
jgi:DNA-binding winged helix-turn-helix (wHTH) protein